jgi:hypothetical protein
LLYMHKGSIIVMQKPWQVCRAWITLLSRTDDVYNHKLKYFYKKEVGQLNLHIFHCKDFAMIGNFFHIRLKII